MRYVRDLRLIPVVLFAAACLAALKVLGLLFDGGYLLTELDPATVDRPIHVQRDAETGDVITDNKIVMASPDSSWAQQMLGIPEITGSVDKPADKRGDKAGAANAPTGASDKPPDPPPRLPTAAEKQPDGRVIDLTVKPVTSPSERAILEHLQERRQELDSRSREIELREGLLKAAEKKYETHAKELQELESNVGVVQQKKEEAEVQKLKNLVTMYENMKAKDAARIFDRLEMRILVEVASLINPRRMPDIMGQMSSEAAERLTVELANRATSADRAGQKPVLGPRARQAGLVAGQERGQGLRGHQQIDDAQRDQQQTDDDKNGSHETPPGVEMELF